MRRALALGGVLMTLAACGTDAPGPGGGSDTATGTDLAITVTLNEDAPDLELTLTCDPPGGDHPDPEAACAALSGAGAEVFEPVPSDQACTEIYGGPQVATVTGTFEGAEVDATFDRTNGCEIDRWDSLGTAVFDIPMQ